MPAEPLGQVAFWKRAGSDGQHRSDGILRIKPKPLAIVGQKEAGNHPGRAFIAISKAMVPRQTVRIGCRQIGGIGLTVGSKILWAGKGGMHGAQIPYAVQAAMLGKLPVVDRKGHLGTNPPPGRHLARARRMSRSSCMMASASVI